MFERFTEKARRAVFFARYEASQFGSPYIETEHLLLGILREDKALTNRLLPPSASAESIRKQIAENTTIRSKISTSVDLPLSNECKRILAYAAEESERLSHSFIGTGHLFLGVLREQGCFAAKLLKEKGVTLATTREQVAGNPPQELGPTPRSPGLPAGYTSSKLLYNIAAGTLILELRRASSIFLPTRLFVRHKDAEAYEQIGSPAADVSYESPVTCEKHPLVVFNSKRWDKVRKGGDWDGVYSFNLSTKELALCISKEKLRLSEPHGRLSIVELVSLSEDARTLYAKIDVEKSVSGGGIVHYYLAKVDLADQEVTLLSRFMDTLF
jgi:hypothetical protein